MPTLIRACSEADLPAVRTLLAETWHATYDRWLGPETVREIGETWHSEKQLVAQIGRLDCLFLVAENNHGLAGTAFAHDAGNSRVEIGRLYVHPRQQCQGTGSGLLRAMLDGFPATSRFGLDVEPRNSRAIAFYRRHGFAPVATSTDCGGAGSGIAGLRMEWAR